MNSKTGEIKVFKSDAEARAAGFDVPLDDPSMVKELIGVSRRKRLAKYKEILNPVKALAEATAKDIAKYPYKIRKSKSR